MPRIARSTHPRIADRARSSGRRTRRIVALVAATLAAVAVPSAYAQTTPNPVTCDGYPEPRLFLESQSWWRDNGDPPLGGASEHAHSATCFPYLQTVKGAVRFDVRSLMHNMHGARLEWVRVQVYSSAYGTKTLKAINPKSGCDAHDCEFWNTLYVDTSQLPNDGLAEFRIHTEAQGPSGDRYRNLATTGWPAYVKNGKTVKDNTGSARDNTEGRGWYREPDGKTERGYENARFVGRLPQAPVSGIWEPRVRTLAGSGGEKVTRSFASIDPRFHAMPEDRGKVVLDKTGSFDGTLRIDTTQLADGAHKLFLRADAAEPTGELAGALVIPFVVDNSSTSEPTPDEPAGGEGPSIAVTQPFEGQVVSGWIGLDVDVSDPDGVSRVEYYVDGKLVAYDDTPSDFGEPWDSRKVANGQHSIVARAFDSLGNAADSLPVGFSVEN